MRSLTKLTAAALMGLGIAAAVPATQAQAHGYVQPAYYGYGYSGGYYAPPVPRYYAPPVYAAPPVYYAPRPRFFGPPPWAYRHHGYGYGRRW